MICPVVQEPGAGDRPWLFWDGACGFCCWSVRWLSRRGGERALRIVPYQDAPDEFATPEFRERAARAVQVVTPTGERLEAGRACLYVLREIGWTWIGIFRFPPLVWLVEMGYWIAARNRGFLARFVSEDPKRCREEQR